MSGTQTTGGGATGVPPGRPEAAAAPRSAQPAAPRPASPHPTPTAAQLRRSEAPSGSVTVAPAPGERPPGPRRARVYVTRVDPWSVMKAGFMLALVIAVVVVVAVAALWWVLDVTGVFEALARNVDEIVGGGTSTFDLENFIGFSRVMGVAIVVAAMEIVLVSVLATLFAFGYNLTVGITGGIEVTLSDE